MLVQRNLQVVNERMNILSSGVMVKIVLSIIVNFRENKTVCQRGS